MSNLVTWSSPLGGAGTTTAVWHMAQTASSLGEPVLMVDLSPMGTLSRLAATDQGPGLAGVLTGSLDLQSAIRKTRVDNVHILPSGALQEMLLAEALSDGSLGNLLSSLAEGPHPVFLDLPAGLPFLYSVAVSLSSWVLLALPCKKEAIWRLPAMVAPLKSNAGPRRSVGIVISRFAAWSKAEFDQYQALRRSLPGSALWRTVIPIDDVFNETTDRGLPATVFSPESPGARAFFDLFGEWTARKALAQQKHPTDKGRPDAEEQ